MKRLNSKDWALIAEALEMLLLDYPEEEAKHPKHDRLLEIEQYAINRADYEDTTK